MTQYQNVSENGFVIGVYDPNGDQTPVVDGMITDTSDISFSKAFDWAGVFDTSKPGTLGHLITEKAKEFKPKPEQESAKLKRYRRHREERVKAHEIRRKTQLPASSRAIEMLPKTTTGKVALASVPAAALLYTNRDRVGASTKKKINESSDVRRNRPASVYYDDYLGKAEDILYKDAEAEAAIQRSRHNRQAAAVAELEAKMGKGHRPTPAARTPEEAAAVGSELKKAQSREEKNRKARERRAAKKTAAEKAGDIANGAGEPAKTSTARVGTTENPAPVKLTPGVKAPTTGGAPGNGWVPGSTKGSSKASSTSGGGSTSGASTTASGGSSGGGGGTTGGGGSSGGGGGGKKPPTKMYPYPPGVPHPPPAKGGLADMINNRRVKYMEGKTSRVKARTAAKTKLNTESEKLQAALSNDKTVGAARRAKVFGGLGTAGKNAGTIATLAGAAVTGGGMVARKLAQRKAAKQALVRAAARKPMSEAQQLGAIVGIPTAAIGASEIARRRRVAANTDVDKGIADAGKRLLKKLKPDPSKGPVADRIAAANTKLSEMSGDATRATRNVRAMSDDVRNIVGGKYAPKKKGGIGGLSTGQQVGLGAAGVGGLMIGRNLAGPKPYPYQQQQG